MTINEQRIEWRRHERFQVVSQPSGAAFLRIGENVHAVAVIVDISNFGIRVYLDQRVAVPTAVTIEYVEPHRTLEVSGTVAWCAPRWPGKNVGDGLGEF